MENNQMGSPQMDYTSVFIDQIAEVIADKVIEKMKVAFARKKDTNNTASNPEPVASNDYHCDPKVSAEKAFLYEPLSKKYGDELTKYILSNLTLNVASKFADYDDKTVGLINEMVKRHGIQKGLTLFIPEEGSSTNKPNGDENKEQQQSIQTTKKDYFTYWKKRIDDLLSSIEAEKKAAALSHLKKKNALYNQNSTEKQMRRTFAILNEFIEQQ